MHKLTLNRLAWAGENSLAARCLHNIYSFENERLSQDYLGIHFNNPMGPVAEVPLQCGGDVPRIQCHFSHLLCPCLSQFLEPAGNRPVKHCVSNLGDQPADDGRIHNHVRLDPLAGCSSKPLLKTGDGGFVEIDG